MIEIVGWRGDRVALWPLERQRHLENAYRWLNDPDATAHVQANLGVSWRQEEGFFDRFEAQRENDFVWGIHDETGRHIGLVGLHGINWMHRFATGGILIGDRSAWGRGNASDAVRVRSRFAFRQLGLNRLDGHTFNPAMRRVYEKCGYRHEGVSRRKFWRDGEWHDIHLYGLLAEDWSSA